LCAEGRGVGKAQWAIPRRNLVCSPGSFLGFVSSNHRAQQWNAAFFKDKVMCSSKGRQLLGDAAGWHKQLALLILYNQAILTTELNKEYEGIAHLLWRA